MKLNLQKDDLLYAVAAVARAVSSKNTMPILSGILLQAPADQPGKLILSATDLELAMECMIDAEIEENGQVVAPGRYLLDLVRHLPEGPVTLISGNKDELILNYEQSQSNIRCLDPDEFPALPTAEGDLHGHIPLAVFRRMVKQVSIAAATDEVRPLFTGVLIDLTEQGLTMVASDTHRLAIAFDDWQGEGEAKLIIPCRTMQEIARLASGDEGLIEITASRNQAYFKFDNIVLASRVIAGQYPDYNQVLPLPSLYKTHTVIQRERLTLALERAALLSRDVARGKANIVCLHWQADGLLLTAEAPDVGHIHEELPATLEGEEMCVNYNARYLLDALKVIDEESVAFHLTGETTPGIILPASQELTKSAYTYLVLPIRVTR